MGSQCFSSCVPLHSSGLVPGKIPIISRLQSLMIIIPAPIAECVLPIPSGVAIHHHTKVCPHTSINELLIYKHYNYCNIIMEVSSDPLLYILQIRIPHFSLLGCLLQGSFYQFSRYPLIITISKIKIICCSKKMQHDGKMHAVNMHIA
jgi:hypothetical protein